MSDIIRYERKSYDVRDHRCIGRACLRLHPVQIRGLTMSGSRGTGKYAYECVQRFYWGCPEEGDARLEYDKSLAAKRRKEGYK